MKKIIYVSIALVLYGVLPGTSQILDSKMDRFSIGVIGGLNFADMHFPNSHGPDDQEIKSLLRFGVGAVLDINLSDHIATRFEPMYLQKGCKIEEGSDPVNQPEGHVKSSYIELLMLVKYSFGVRIEPYLIAGPTIGYNLRSEIDFDLTGLKFIGDITEVTSTFDFGIIFGGGVQVPVSIGRIFIEGKYSYGIANQRQTGSVTLNSGSFQLNMGSDREDDKYTNRGIHIMVGITLPL